MANYRDDRDALRNKADVLAGELEGAKAELDQAEAENDAKDAEIARLRKLAGERRPDDQQKHKRAIIWGSAALTLVVGGAVGFLTMVRPAPSATRAAPADASPAGATPATPAQVTKVRFTAKASKVAGRTDVKVGDPCTVDVDTVLSAGGKQPFDELVVSCAGAELYRLSNRAGTVMSMSSWNLSEATGGYALEYEDVGQRSSDARAQTAISSGKKAGRIFSEGALPAEVLLDVEPVGKKR